MNGPDLTYASIWNGEQQECEECHEMTDELFERGDLKHVCEGCLNTVDEDGMKEDRWNYLAN